MLFAALKMATAFFLLTGSEPDTLALDLRWSDDTGG